jgi:hypothetical protein
MVMPLAISRLREGGGGDHWRQHGGDAVAVDCRTSVATAEKSLRRKPMTDYRVRCYPGVRPPIMNSADPSVVWGEAAQGVPQESVSPRAALTAARAG